MAQDLNTSLNTTRRTSPKNTALFLGAVALLILLIVLFVWPGLKRDGSDTTAPVVIPVELITGTVLKEDFDLSAYPDPNKVDMVTFESNDEIEVLKSSFENYFRRNNWRVVQDAKLAEDIYVIVGQNSDSTRSVQVNIDSQNLNEKNKPPFNVLIIYRAN